MTAIRINDLTLLGLSDGPAVVYMRLLTAGPSDIETLADDTGQTPTEIHDALDVLREAGLVSFMDDSGSAVPMRPGPALDLLIRRREAELRQARVVAISAYEGFVRAVGGEPANNLIEVIPGNTVSERIAQLERSAHEEILGFDSPPYYADADANQVELDNLSRGVRYRVVYATAALGRGDYLADNVIPGVLAGEEARTLPEVPVKLMIFDDDCAVVSQSLPQPADCDVSALLIRPCALLSALIGLFEMCWQAALPFDVRDRPASRYLQPNERRLLGLLAAGMGDDQAARALGVSRRTLFRYLEGMMARTGAANRFQLALHAVRNGWI
ncbi:MAG TPA: helix-turn-helix transcriptional regulator [Pseudonocardiaceae bacterium]|nr:helix-turn-helix transcriptional regulator [Pseudonocardiaceae bacterium]